MPRIIATIAVRMGSERFPGKPMREIAGRPMLGHLLDRVKQVKRLNGIVVATPEHPDCDIIEAFCASEGVACFRGSEDDVLGRLLGALESQKADVGVEIYGDGPLIDPALIDECLDEYLHGDYDLVGNDMKPGYPSGMYNEVFSVHALKNSTDRCSNPTIREHGTLYLRQHPESYNVKHTEAKGDLNRSDIHLDVDTERDAKVIEAIINHFSPRNDFSLSEIIDFLDAHLDIRDLNASVHRRWKQYQHT